MFPRVEAISFIPGELGQKLRSIICVAIHTFYMTINQFDTYFFLPQSVNRCTVECLQAGEHCGPRMHFFLISTSQVVACGLRNTAIVIAMRLTECDIHQDFVPKSSNEKMIFIRDAVLYLAATSHIHSYCYAEI